MTDLHTSVGSLKLLRGCTTRYQETNASVSVNKPAGTQLIALFWVMMKDGLCAWQRYSTMSGTAHSAMRSNR